MKTLDEVEKEQVLKALVVFGNNKSRAAAALGVTVKTLYNKLHKWGLMGSTLAEIKVMYEGMKAAEGPTKPSVESVLKLPPGNA